MDVDDDSNNTDDAVDEGVGGVTMMRIINNLQHTIHRKYFTKQEITDSNRNKR